MAVLCQRAATNSLGSSWYETVQCTLVRSHKHCRSLTLAIIIYDIEMLYIISFRDEQSRKRNTRGVKC